MASDVEHPSEEQKVIFVLLGQSTLLPLQESPILGEERLQLYISTVSRSENHLSNLTPAIVSMHIARNTTARLTGVFATRCSSMISQTRSTLSRIFGS